MSRIKLYIGVNPSVWYNIGKNWKRTKFVARCINYLYTKEYTVGISGVKTKVEIIHRDNRLPAIKYRTAVGNIIELFYKKGNQKEGF